MKFEVLEVIDDAKQKQAEEERRERLSQDLGVNLRVAFLPNLTHKTYYRLQAVSRCGLKVQQMSYSKTKWQTV